MAAPVRIHAEVKSIEKMGSGVYRVDLSVPAFQNRFLAGQFLHLTLDEFDPSLGYWPESRVFSIASVPKSETVTFVYSVKGRYTTRMEAELAVGKKVWIKFPYGDFIVKRLAKADRPIVFVGGGTGVAPFVPFLYESLSAPAPAPVHLFYGIRQAEHLLFRELWNTLSGTTGIDLTLACEGGPVEGLESVHGRLSVPLLKSTLGAAFSKAQFFLSGPPIMIQAFRTELLNGGTSPEDIHIDEWE